MTDGHWWTVRVVAWGVIVGCVMSLVSAQAAIFVLGALIFAYFALEIWIEDNRVMELDTDEHDEFTAILERDCS